MFGEKKEIKDVSNSGKGRITFLNTVIFSILLIGMYFVPSCTIIPSCKDGLANAVTLLAGKLKTPANCVSVTLKRSYCFF